MNIDPADFEQGPRKTDEGFPIEFHAYNGSQQAIIALSGLPHGEFEQVPQIKIEGERYVYDYTDEHTGYLIFTEFHTSIPADGEEPTPVLASKFDDVELPPFED